MTLALAPNALTRFILAVHLGALQAVGIVHVQRLPLRIKIQRRRAGLAMAVAGLLGAAKRQMDLRADGRRVDVNDARCAGRASPGRPCSRRACRSTPKGRTHAVGDLERLLEIVERASPPPPARKSLPARCASSDRNRQKPSARGTSRCANAPSRQTMTAGRQLRALILSDLHVLHHRLQLLSR